MNLKKILAFTLAEVLITLGIVGTVAAMTIPTLNYNRIKREKTVRLKRFYSKMTNAIEAMNIDRPFRQMTAPSGTVAARDWYMENVDPYMGHKSARPTSSKHTSPAIFYNDGSALKIIESRTSCVDVGYDTNGDKGPNLLGHDIFFFNFCFTDAGRMSHHNSKNDFFGPFTKRDGYYNSGHQVLIDEEDRININDSDFTRDVVLEECKQEPAACSKLLQMDDWEFKSDYPKSFPRDYQKFLKYKK